MFNCEHGAECPLDLWSPDLVRTKVGNVAFSVYAKHTQEKEDIIDCLVEAARAGQSSVELDVDDYLTPEEWEEIEREVRRRL